MKKLTVAACALALVLAAATPAAARHHVGVAETQTFVAYGTDNTICEIELQKYTFGWMQGDDAEAHVEGHTDCTVPVQQTVTAAMNEPGEETYPCSDFARSCWSSAMVAASKDFVGRGEVRVRLRAPLGQGWVGSPKECSGVGTDNLNCTFQAYVAWPWLKSY